MSEHERENRHQAQYGQHCTVTEGAAVHHDGAVAEEVEEEPGDEDQQENDHGDRMPQEAEEDDQKHRHGVIDSEIAQVPSHAAHGGGVALREREGGESEELVPWAARGDHGLSRLLGSRDE